MNKPKLNSMQMMTLISAGTLGVDILTVPRRMVESSGQDAWISILLGGLLTLIFGTLAYILAVQYPDKDFPEILISIGGKFCGYTLSPHYFYNIFCNAACSAPGRSNPSEAYTVQ